MKNSNLLKSRKKEPLYLIIVFLILTLGIGLAGYLYSSRQKNSLTEKVKNELSAVGVLKIDQINAWRKERISDGETIAGNQFMINVIKKYFYDKDNETKTSLLNWFNVLSEKYGYKEISLLDKNSNLSISTSKNIEPVFYADSKDIEKAWSEKKVILSDFHVSDSLSSDIHLDVIVPLIDSKENDSSNIGYLILEIDPSAFLFPLIQTWPVRSTTAESMLIRKEGDNVLHLNELRNKKNTAMKLKVPLSSENRILVLAISGENGIIEGTDYRGEEVLAYVQFVPGTPWCLINKIDKSEIYDSGKEQTELIFALTFVLIIACAASIGFYQRHKNVIYFQEKYKIELEKKSIARRYKYLLNYANDAILLLNSNFKILEANEKATILYGYSMDELKNLGVDNIQSNIGKFLFEQNKKNINNEAGLIFESEHLKKDGTLFSVEISACPVTIKGELFYQYIVRDISDRKKIEKELKENETKYRELIEQASDGIVINDEKGKILFVNPKACEMLGYNESELLNLNVSDTYEEEEKELSFSRRKQIVNGYAINFERNIRGKDGRSFPVEISLKRLHNKNFQGIIRDITERKKYDEELNQSRKEFVELFENSPMGMYRTTPDGRILKANKAFIEMMGYNSLEDYSKRNLEEDIIQEGYSRNAFKEMLEKQGEIKGLEAEWTRCDGLKIQVRENARIVKDENENTLFYEGTLENITEKKKMERILREREETSRVLLNAISESVLLFDTNGKILAINDTACKRLNGTEKDFLGNNLYNLYSGTLLQKRRDAATEAITTATPQRLEDEREGRFYDLVFYPALDENGNVTKVAVFGNDITEKKRAEEQLKILYRAVEQSPASVVITDTEGNIEYVNPKFTEVTGYATNEVIGQNPRVLKSGITSDEEYKVLWETITNGKVWHGEFNNKKKNGETYWESAFISPIRNDKDETIHYLAVKEDVTEKKMKNEQLQKSLKEKDLMLKEIYHRVKNNLQIIISLLKLQEGYIKDKSDVALFKVSQTRIKTMALIHEQLYRSADLTRIYFEDYVDKLTKHLMDAYDKRNINLNIKARGIYLDIENAIPCGLIINEIISNSFKHAFPNYRMGKIDVEMVSPNAGTYRLTIRDDGIGFPGEIDFRDTKSLGMQLVVTLTEQLGGIITLNAEKGTEFIIEFTPAMYDKRN